MSSSDADIPRIGALADDVRRELYLYVSVQVTPVSREQAAEAVGVATHRAKFHLDRLESEGLLEAVYARVGGRSGPGAGRTSKLYRRSDREFAVSLPAREYLLAGQLLADAVAESAETGDPVRDVLHRLATARGAGMGAEALAASGRPSTASAALDLALATLARYGYEPRRDGERAILANCPFHALAQSQRQLVCHMNHALISGLVDSLAPPRLKASLDAVPGRCCVTLAIDSQ